MREDPISGVAVRISVVGGSNLTALQALNRAVLANLTLHEPLATDSARDFNVTYAELLSTVDAGRPIVRTVRNPTGGTGTITQYKFFDNSRYEMKFTGINTGMDASTTTGTWATAANCVGLQPDNDDSANILMAYYPADSIPNPSSRTRGLLYLGSDLYLIE
ncbi:hypothetical protein WJX72_001829 [[Myrmecia] bisecta]|uniref:Uncharacterized protein n=1 Tax=[Myrmecia] bisecta TaxID=41462 RepID=A0AAW1NYF2_9CHLO